mgnify:CR=1 FL=1
MFNSVHIHTAADILTISGHEEKHGIILTVTYADEEWRAEVSVHGRFEALNTATHLLGVSDDTLSSALDTFDVLRWFLRRCTQYPLIFVDSEFIDWDRTQVNQLAAKLEARLVYGS